VDPAAGGHPLSSLSLHGDLVAGLHRHGLGDLLRRRLRGVVAHLRLPLLVAHVVARDAFHPLELDLDPGGTASTGHARNAERRPGALARPLRGRVEAPVQTIAATVWARLP